MALIFRVWLGCTLDLLLTMYDVTIYAIPGPSDID